MWNTINVNSKKKTPTISNTFTLHYIQNKHNKYKINSRHDIHNKRTNAWKGLWWTFRLTMDNKYIKYITLS